MAKQLTTTLKTTIPLMIPLITHIFLSEKQHRRTANLTELTQNSDPINTTLPSLPNINIPSPRLQRQNPVHFYSEPIILNNSTKTTPINNQKIQITPQQLVNVVRQLNSQNSQQ